jgi:hypothetical protein
MNDRDRLLFFMTHGPRQFEGVSTDLEVLARKIARHELPSDPYADDVPESERPEAHDEPTVDDYLRAYRMLIDEAIKFQMRKPFVEIVVRARDADAANVDRLCVICTGSPLPAEVGRMSTADLNMLAHLINLPRRQ